MPYNLNITAQVSVNYRTTDMKFIIKSHLIPILIMLVEILFCFSHQTERKL